MIFIWLILNINNIHNILFMTNLRMLFDWYFTLPITFIYILVCIFYVYTVYIYKQTYIISKPYIINLSIIKTVFVFWNVLASLFSLYCFTNVIEYMSSELIENGLQYHICDPNVEFRYPLTGIFLYCVTKPLEFFDSYLLMLYNKPLIFLHWYHHVLTVLSVLFISVNKTRHSTMGLWFGINNLFVHTIMYAYYALTAFRNPLNGLLRNYSYIITLLQIVQMVVGVYLVYISLACMNASNNMLEIYLYGGMYTSYFVLFGKLLYDKVKIK